MSIDHSSQDPNGGWERCETTAVDAFVGWLHASVCRGLRRTINERVFQPQTDGCMKLYDSSRAPNPRRVRVFLAEKGLVVEREEVDIATHQHRSEAYTKINPLQRMPALMLDDGTILTESIAICRYLEELHPLPPLFGRTPLERAFVEMWQRRLELHLFQPVGLAFRHSHPAMVDLEVPQISTLAEVSRSRALEFLSFLDSELAKREFVAGAEFSVADITGLVAIDFMRPARIPLPDELTQVRRWHAALASRPSARA
jgi:glutathione S-transferase